jgi:hypothetical protein
VLGTALTNVARRVIKTPGNTHETRTLVNKWPNHTEKQPVRAKPRAAPLLHSSPARVLPVLHVHPPASTGDQSLDFSLLHTMTSVHGQVKVSDQRPIEDRTIGAADCA